MGYSDLLELSFLLLGRDQQDTLSSLVMKVASGGDVSTPEAQLARMSEEVADRRVPIPDHGPAFGPWKPVVEKLKPEAGVLFLPL